MASPERGKKVKLEADFSFTEESLKANQAVWERTFGRALADYGGSLAKENLGNFQVEYAKIRDANRKLTPQEAGDQAIRNVSFGKGRIRIGFGDLSVEMTNFGDITITEGRYKGESVTNVPRKVTVSARRVAGSSNKP